jgi:hypothetical protein
MILFLILLKDADLEDGNLANFNRWLHLWRFRVGPNGDMTTANLEMGQLTNSVNKRTGSAISNVCDSPYDNSVFWTNLGPFNSQGAIGDIGNPSSCSGYLHNKQNQGRVESISVHPLDQDEILLGAYNGGHGCHLMVVLIGQTQLMMKDIQYME